MKQQQLLLILGLTLLFVVMIVSGDVTSQQKVSTNDTKSNSPPKETKDSPPFNKPTPPTPTPNTVPVKIEKKTNEKDLKPPKPASKPEKGLKLKDQKAKPKSKRDDRRDYKKDDKRDNKKDGKRDQKDKKKVRRSNLIKQNISNLKKLQQKNKPENKSNKDMHNIFKAVLSIYEEFVRFKKRTKIRFLKLKLNLAKLKNKTTKDFKRVKGELKDGKKKKKIKKIQVHERLDNQHDNHHQDSQIHHDDKSHADDHHSSPPPPLPSPPQSLGDHMMPAMDGAVPPPPSNLAPIPSDVKPTAVGNERYNRNTAPKVNVGKSTTGNSRSDKVGKRNDKKDDRRRRRDRNDRHDDDDEEEEEDDEEDDRDDRRRSSRPPPRRNNVKDEL